MNDIKFKLPGFTKIFLFIVILGLIALGLLAIALKPTTSGISQIQLDNGAQTTLAISSNLIKDASPSAYKTAVNIDTGENKITAVQLELSYNPKVLQNIDISPGTFFANPNILLKNIDTQSGRVSYALGVNNGVSGKGNIAVISFSVIPGYEETPIAINFEPKTQVTAENLTNSALKSTNGVSFILNTTPIKISSQSSF